MMTSKTGNVMIHFLLISFSFPVFSKLESTRSQPFLIQLICNFEQIPSYRSYKILTSKTGNVMVHFLLSSISFPVSSKLESTLSQPFLIQLI